MQIKNNYDKDVYNGDIGVIESIDTEEGELTLNFDGKLVDYAIGEMDEITLAYAITVHKSQGSEYKIVLAPMATQHYIMLQKNLLYTCVTRAKTILIMIGTKKAIWFAVNNDKSVLRNTLFAKRLIDEISDL